MISTLTYTIVLLGTATVVLSIFVAVEFNFHRKNLQGDPKKLTRALQFQLLGEAVIGGGTLAFAMAAHMGYLSDWPVWFQSTLRLIMFFATSVTTLHLYKVVRFLNQ